MAGVFALIRGPQPQRELVGRHGMAQRTDPRALELQAAMEILAEVFGIKPVEVKEMIHNHFEVSRSEEVSLKENGLWPREFWLSD